MLSGPVYFGDGTREAVEKVKDSGRSRPMERSFSTPSVFSAAASAPSVPLYSFYNKDDSVLLWEKAGIRGFADLSGLDLVRRKLIAELLLNYAGW
ncbi:hypothetical protein AWB68_06910 [Caballeronia choica]|uniref:Uncharacterized protein n=1 Tax=Caballeronia choica TaxID=326476 RepID=A0A158KQM5_9BURK|nr:hypothetical protein [Caballeronia choica]SAL83448.1 hypothetical protein AWB68_06910 [Caballeronia choica]